MLNITKQERLVLMVLASVLFFGSTLEYAFKKYPELKDVVNLVDSESIYRKVNVNKASSEELIDIPYIGEYTAENIIDYRERNGPFASLDEIKAVKGIREGNYRIFKKYLVVK